MVLSAHFPQLQWPTACPLWKVSVRGYYQKIADMLDLDRMGVRLSGPPSSRLLARSGQQIRSALAWGVLLLAAMAAFTFVGDYAVLRYRMAAQKDPFGAVTVRRFYAVRLKSGKTEFLFQDPRLETCVNSLVPHFEMAPCWSTRRHPERRIDI